MVEPAPRVRMTYAQYRAAEAVSAVKHEYLRSEVWAMAGGTREHGRLAANVIRALGTALQGRPCVLYTSDVRVRIPETERATYPDVSVVCGSSEPAADDPDALTNPVVLVEVLSDSSEASDRGEKFAHYRRIASLVDYVLVSQREPRIEVFHREPDGRWTLAEAGPGQDALLASLGVSLSVDEVHRDPLASPAR